MRVPPPDHSRPDARDGAPNASVMPRLLRGLVLGSAAEGRDGWIAPGRRVDIRLQAGHIVSIEPATRLREAGQADVMDARHLIGFPGLINAHVHSNESFEQGAYDAVSLEEWLVLCYPPLAGEKVVPRLDYLRAMMIAMQSLSSGVAGLHDDFVNPVGDPERLDAVLSAYADIGIRASVACTFADRPYLDGLPDGRDLCPPTLRARLDQLGTRSIRDQVRFYETARKRLIARHNVRLRLTLGPRGPQRCTPALMRTVAALSAERATPVHMHVLESRAQWLAGLRQHGSSLVKVLADTGLLSDRLTMNHAIWLSADDIALMREHGAMTVHNPMSNFKLSSGLSPVKALLAAGIDVALGSDGPATGDSPDFLQSVRFAALIHKLDVGRATDAPRVDDIMAMISTAGARSMGAKDCGRLAVGYRADLTFFDARHLAFVPLNHALRQLAYSAGADAVHSVMVEGELVYAAGRYTRIDAVAVRAEIAEAAARFRRDVLGKRASANREMLPFIRKVVTHARRATGDTGTVNRVLLA